MAKKQFIRHLEYYGFPDQNNYTSDVNASVDLSDIIKKNEEQDEAIANLGEEEWASEEELHRLNEKVNDFVDAQNSINNQIQEGMSSLGEDVNNLKENSNSFAEELSGVTDAVNDLMDDVTAISGELITMDEKVEAVGTKIDEATQYAEETYANKSSVYTKDEVNEAIEDMATKTWVNDQGFITTENGDARYASNSRVDSIENALSGDVTTIIDNISSLSAVTTEQIDEMSEKVDEVSSEIGVVSTTVTSMKSEIEDRLSVDEIRLNDVENETALLSASKVGKSDLEAVSGTLNSSIVNLSNQLDDKIDGDDFEDYKISVNTRFNNLDSAKADRSELATSNNRIANVEGGLNAEALTRMNDDNALSNRISDNHNEIIDIKSKNVQQDDAINDLANDLAQEIVDRETSDAAIIGNASDTLTANTINGAKRYADNIQVSAQQYADVVGDRAVSASKTYTESKFNDVEQMVSAKSDKTYVDELNAETESTLSSQITTAVTSAMTLIDAEKMRAMRVEGEIITNISALTNSINDVATKVNDITNDGGTGELDILHNELHSLIADFNALIQTLTDKHILP